MVDLEIRPDQLHVPLQLSAFDTTKSAPDLWHISSTFEDVMNIGSATLKDILMICFGILQLVSRISIPSFTLICGLTKKSIGIVPYMELIVTGKETPITFIPMLSMELILKDWPETWMKIFFFRITFVVRSKYFGENLSILGQPTFKPSVTRHFWISFSSTSETRMSKCAFVNLSFCASIWISGQNSFMGFRRTDPSNWTLLLLSRNWRHTLRSQSPRFLMVKSLKLHFVNGSDDNSTYCVGLSLIISFSLSHSSTLGFNNV